MKPIVTFLRFTISPRLINRKCDKGRLVLYLLPLLLIQILIQPPISAQPRPEDTLLFREGELFLSKGEPENALKRFQRLIADFPKSSLSNESKFRMGICYTQLNKPKEAISILNELLSTFLSPTRMTQVFTLLGENHLELKDRLSALHWYGKGLLVPGQTSGELKKRIRSIIDTYDTEEDLTHIESLYRGAYGGGYAKLKLAKKAHLQGNDPLAKKILIELEKEYRGVDYSPQAKDLLESLFPSGKPKYTLGVILPLSGNYQSFGEKALQGIQLAMKEIAPYKTDYMVSLAIRDSRGSPLEAEKAVEELVTKEKVIAILGPLLSITVDHAAKKAQQLKIPLLTFSQKELLYGDGEFIFQNSLTPSEQVRVLALFATKEMDYRTFAVFCPNSPYGLHYKSLFTKEIVQRGGRLLGVVIYQENQTDFGEEIKRFFKIKTIQKYEDKKKKEQIHKQGLTLDALFIPDTHDRVGLILSQMAYYDIKGVTFLGTNAWNGPGLLSIAGKSAEGAIFVDAFYKNNPSQHVARFVEEFKKAYQREPETLEALCYDGTKILLDLLQRKKISSPFQLKEELRQVQHFHGVSGLKGFGEEGKMNRVLSILKVNHGQIEQISP